MTTGAFPPAEALRLATLIEVQDGGIVSKTLSKGPAGTLTLFAFDQGQELSEHSAPFDAWVQVLDGALELRIGGQAVPAEAGHTVLMPANVPHGLRATRPTRMFLIMIRNPTGEEQP